MTFHLQIHHMGSLKGTAKTFYSLGNLVISVFLEIKGPWAGVNRWHDLAIHYYEQGQAFGVCLPNEVS